MKKILNIVLLLFVSITLFAADSIQIKQPYIPILIDREDNVLYQIRLEAKESKTLNTIDLQLDKNVDLKDIKSIKLYYSGTEAAAKKGQKNYAPVEYISSHAMGMTRKANTSYSILKDKHTSIKNKLTLTANQNLFAGINYFWISIEMQDNAKLTSSIGSEITDIKLDGKSTLVRDNSRNKQARRLGIGVRHAWDDNAAAYRIPGIVTTNDGTLLMVYDVRYNSSVDLQEYIDVGLSRSTDKGQTWEDMRLVMRYGEHGGLPKAQNGVGDPAILVDEETGQIWVVAAWTHGMGNERSWFNSMQGMTKEETAQLVMVKSSDDGKTWSKPINFTDQLKQPEWYFLLQGPGRGITMKDGTIVFANQYIGADRIPNAGIMYSKDKGQTWQTHNYARTNTTEAQVVEVEPGVLMLNMRDNRGGSRAVYTTTDMGETWKEHESSRTALREPVCMASLIHVDAKDNVLNKDILFFSNPNTTNGRKDITIKASLDGGYTWYESDQILLDEGYSWGYSCLTMVDKETVGIVYESSVAHMTFQAVKIQELIK